MSRWYIKLHRSSQDDPLYFAEPFTKWQAWQDLRLIANHADGFFFVRWNKVEVKRWRVARGENDLCKRWKWSRDKVRNFLKLLENMWKIIQQKNRICSIYIIVNYDDDQTTDQTTDPTTEKQQTLQQKNINNNNKKEKNEKEWKKKFTTVDDFYQDIIEWDYIDKLCPDIDHKRLKNRIVVCLDWRKKEKKQVTIPKTAITKRLKDRDWNRNYEKKKIEYVPKTEEEILNAPLEDN